MAGMFLSRINWRLYHETSPNLTFNVVKYVHKNTRVYPIFFELVYTLNIELYIEWNV